MSALDQAIRELRLLEADVQHDAPLAQRVHHIVNILEQEEAE